MVWSADFMSDACACGRRFRTSNVVDDFNCEVLHIKVVGLARIAADVTPELALATIASISVLGALQASAEIKAALADRIA